jgi:hypothetical protein
MRHVAAENGHVGAKSGKAIGECERCLSRRDGGILRIGFIRTAGKIIRRFHSMRDDFTPNLSS